MFENRELNAWRLRKEALLRQSAAHRAALMTEAQGLQPVAAWMDLGIAAGQKLRSSWQSLVPLLSLWQARKQESGGLIGKITRGIALACSLAEFWKQWR